MRKLNLCLLAACFASLVFLFQVIVWAQGGPYLVCDPPLASDQITAYNVYIDGAAYMLNVPAEPDGSLKLSLANLAPDKYTWTAKAINAWGESGESDPYISPSVAGVPQNLRMEY